MHPTAVLQERQLKLHSVSRSSSDLHGSESTWGTLLRRIKHVETHQDNHRKAWSEVRAIRGPF